MNWGSVEREGCTVSLECWRQIHISWDNASVKKRVHSICNVIFSDRRWVRERVIAELFRKNALGRHGFVLTSLTNTQLFQFNIADATLAASVFELVWRCDSKLCADEIVTILVLRVTGQKAVLHLVHPVLHSFVDHVVRWRLCT